MNKIGFIYQEGENDKDRFKVFDTYVEESKEKITKAADNLLNLYKSEDLDGNTRKTLKELEKKLRLVFKEVDEIDKEVEEIARQNRLNKN